MDPLRTIYRAHDLLDAEELAYHRAEREGMRLDSELCAECPDPGLCQAEGECCAGGFPDGVEVPE